MFTALSLFTGIGGIDLAFERAGFQIVGQVEIDDYCNAVLNRHWPNVPRWRDVRTFGRNDYTGTVDVVAGGFPCQDISVAGKGAGIQEGNRSGLWFEFARIIGEFRPRYVFIENVPAITTNGGTTVIAQLTAMGYDAQWGIVAASDVGAPQGRKRWFCVAVPQASGKAQQSEITGAQSSMVGAELRASSGIVGGDSPQGIPLGRRTAAGSTEDVADAASRGTPATQQPRQLRGAECRSQDVAVSDGGGLEESGKVIKSFDPTAPENGQANRTQHAGGGVPDADGKPMERPAITRAERSNGTVESRLGRIFDGLPARLDDTRQRSRWPAPPGQPQYRWEAPRTSTGTANRTARLKALGNAVVPQVVQPFAEGIREALESENLA